MKKLFAMTAAVLLLFSVLLGIPAAYGQAPETGKTLDILFSHDTHSNLNTFTTVVEDEETDIGGFARANTLIKAQRAKDPDTLVIDGGDFSMGSLFQTVYATDAPELRALGAMGYDAATLGNHEFDYRQKGLAEMLRAALDSGGPLPAIVQANYTTPMDPVEGRDLPVWLACFGSGGVGFGGFYAGGGGLGGLAGENGPSPRACMVGFARRWRRRRNGRYGQALPVLT